MAPENGLLSIAKLTNRRSLGYFSCFPQPHAMAKAASPSPDSTKTPSFEAALQELERIVQAMEAGDAPLEESLAAYERGMALLKHCQETLSAAEHKLRILENGVLHEFEPPAEGA